MARAAAARSLSEQDALLALALVLLLRCLLDTWDAGYYPLPFLLALLAWEVARPGRRPPLLALAATVLVWLSFHWLPAHVGADAQAALFLAWSLPLALWLGLSLFASSWLERRGRRLGASLTREIRLRGGAVAQPLARERRATHEPRRARSRSGDDRQLLGQAGEHLAAPSSTTTRSSMRTPSSPGR